VPLLKLTLEQCGFEIVHEIAPPAALPEQWKTWHRWQRGYIALRRTSPRTAYFGGRIRRLVPRHPALQKSIALLKAVLGIVGKR